MCFNYRASLGCCFVFTTSIMAQTEPSVPFPELLYQMDDVTKALNITENQIKSLDKLTEKMQATYLPRYTRLNSRNDADTVLRTQELNRQYRDEWLKGSRDILSDDQRIRYQQLTYQFRGFDAFKDTDIQRSLGLTSEQLNKLDEEIEWSSDKLSDIDLVGGILPERAYKLYPEYWTKLQERYAKFLTPKQLKLWREMTGEPFVFQWSFHRLAHTSSK